MATPRRGTAARRAGAVGVGGSGVHVGAGVLVLAPAPTGKGVAVITAGGLLWAVVCRPSTKPAPAISATPKTMAMPAAIQPRLLAVLRRVAPGRTGSAARHRLQNIARALLRAPQRGQITFRPTSPVWPASLQER
jgi:hypothetical protein